MCLQTLTKVQKGSPVPAFLQFGAPPYNTAPSLMLDPQTPREYAQGSMSDWLHMQIGNAYERVT